MEVPSAILASVSTRVKNSFNTNTGHCDTKNIFGHSCNCWILLADTLPIFEKSLFCRRRWSVPQVAFHLVLFRSFVGIIVIVVENGIQILIEYKLLATTC